MECSSHQQTFVLWRVDAAVHFRAARGFDQAPMIEKMVSVRDSHVATRGAGANAGAGIWASCLAFSYLKPRRAAVLRPENRYDDLRDQIGLKMLIHGRLCFDQPIPAPE
jgi:hypothetical protein